MNAETLLTGFALRGVNITLVGDAIAFDAPAEVLTSADLDVLRSAKPAIIEHLRSVPDADDQAVAPDADRDGGILCPRCRGRNLIDDPDGIRCVDCDAMAFIDDGAGLVRVDHVGDMDEPLDPLVQHWLNHRDRIMKSHATGKRRRTTGATQ